MANNLFFIRKKKKSLLITFNLSLDVIHLSVYLLRRYQASFTAQLSPAYNHQSSRIGIFMNRARLD